MAKAWSVGAWAADAEEAEKEAEKIPIGKNAEAFPSLGEALAVAPKKKKDKKTTMSLSELMTGKYVGPGGRARTSGSGNEVGFDVIMSLPKGPRERGPEEDGADGLGGAFKDYGGFRGGDRGDRRDDDRRGGRRGFDDDEDAGMPSRADTEDDWGKARKFVPSTGGPPRGGDRDDFRREGPSAADEEGTWSKKFVPSGDRPREGGFGGRGGGGFSDRYEDDRRGGFDGPSKADEVDNWGKTKKFVPSATPARGGGFGGGGGFSDSGDRWGRREEAPPVSSARATGERPRLALQKRTVPVDAPAGEKKEAEENGEEKPAPKPKANPFGAARPREEILQEKGQDWKKLDEDLEKKGKAVPTPPGSASGGSSRGSSPPPVAKSRPKVNPFGAARPREEVLQEKGVDFRKVDLELEHKRVQRDETPEEKALKEEVEQLRLKLQGGGGSQPAAAKEGEGEDKQENGVHEEKASEDVEAELAKKERELDDLIRKLDDKVRFSKATDKPVNERDWRDAKAQAPPPAAAPKPTPKKEADVPTPASPSTAKAAPPAAADVSKRPAAIDTKKEGAKRDSGAVSPSVVKESPKVKPEPVKKAVSAEPTIVKGGFGALQEDDAEDEEETVEEKQGESQEEEPAQKAPEAAGVNKGQDDGRGWEQVKGAGKR